MRYSRKRRLGHFVTEVPRYASAPLRSVVRTPSALSLIEDLRTFHPDYDMRPVRSFFTKPRLVISPAKQSMRNGTRPTIPHKIGFDVPLTVLRCVRRKQRKEVIHAKRLQRKGARGSKSFNLWSDVKC